jgi:hypothetical protein
VGWGVACECVAGTRGVGSGNLARRRRGSAGELFWAGGGGGELERGAALPAVAALKGGRRGDGRFLGLILPGTPAWGSFSTVLRAASAPDRVLPCRASAGALAVYLGLRTRRYVFGVADGTPII